MNETSLKAGIGQHQPVSLPTGPVCVGCKFDWPCPYVRQKDLEADSGAQVHGPGGEHYGEMSPMPIEVIEAWGLGFCDGNALKYLSRWRQKGGLTDLKKARWYLDRMIQQLEAKPDEGR